MLFCHFAHEVKFDEDDELNSVTVTGHS